MSAAAVRLPRWRRPRFAGSTFGDSTLGDAAWQRRRRETLRWAVWGALAGGVAALVAFAPASWLAAAAAGSSGGRLLLADARGTVWSGSAVPVLTGGADSRDASALPGRLQWSMHWRGRGIDVALRHACCLSDGVALRWEPGFGRQRLSLRPATDGTIGQWPAAWLGGLGTPWNTLQLGGRMRLASPGLDVEWVQGRPRVAGSAQLELVGVSSRLSTLDPLGTYRVSLQGDAASEAIAVTLATADGALRLSGQGQLTQGRLRFRGQAQAAAGSEAALTNLLGLLGRREGAVAMITIG
ncbi:MAG: type II secretion system protein N [Burkholderiaceae bacterium]|nr:type II secretion system protein N [Burkholderiaceae bacterium]